MLNKTYYNNMSMLDLLFNTLVGFIVLFTIAFLLVNPDTRKADIETKAEFVITLTWPPNFNSDVDLWAEDPAGNIVFFRERDKGLMHLDRDDLGTTNDEVVINGQTIVNEFNQEILSIRGFLPGEWVVNVQMYANRDGNKEVPVRVKIDKLNPKFITVYNKQIIMREAKEEITITRFIMTSNGDVLEWWDEPKTLIIMESGSVQSITHPGL